MTIAQSDIARYIRTQFAGSYHLDTIGDSRIKLTDKTGNTMTFGINIFGDIMDADTRKIIAVSDLPHNLDLLPLYARPKTWENQPSYFG